MEKLMEGNCVIRSSTPPPNVTIAKKKFLINFIIFTVVFEGSPFTILLLLDTSYTS